MKAEQKPTDLMSYIGLQDDGSSLRIHFWMEVDSFAKNPIDALPCIHECKAVLEVDQPNGSNYWIRQP